jgi:hypothetical protein
VIHYLRKIVPVALCIAVGAVLILTAIGIITTGTARSVPKLVLGAVGLSFWLAGMMMLWSERRRVYYSLAAILLFIVGCMGLWFAMAGAKNSLGISAALASHSTMLVTARLVFGVGAIVCYALCLRVLRRLVRKRQKWPRPF